MKSVFLPIATLILGSASAQLVIDQAVFFIGEGAVVTVQGNLQTNVAIQAGGSGATQGKIQMKGAAIQTITASGANAAIPFLEIDNTNHVKLEGTHDLAVSNRLEFTNGRFQLGNRNLVVPADVVVAGNTAARFVETNGTGEMRQLVNAVGTKMLPIGTGANYTPASYTIAGSTFGAGAYVGVRASGVAVPTPERHPRTESYLGTAWHVSRNAVTGGTVSVQGTYVNGQITGTEADLRGMFWNGSTWSVAGGTQNEANNTVGANVPTTGGLVYGMNKFVLANLTAVLQGAYNSGTGLMTDAYRANNLLPNTDPYRTFTNFAHVANDVPEEITNASVFGVQANQNHNIVDWVFIQLRAANAPSTVVQTRAALIRANGEIIDIDNASPLYFKNLDPGNYVLTLRHRNHLAMSNNPASPISLNLTPISFNYSTAAAGAVLGTANTNYLFSNSVRQMYAGDVNSNGTSNYSALGATDRSVLLSLLSGGVPTGSRTISNSSDYLLYSRGDINFNRTVNYSALGVTDRSYLLSSVIGGVPTTSKVQANPN